MASKVRTASGLSALMKGYLQRAACRGALYGHRTEASFRYVFLYFMYPFRIISAAAEQKRTQEQLI